VYAADPARLYREAAFYHLYWKVTDSALANAWQAILKRPVAFKNLFCLAYCSVLSLNYWISRLNGRHYSQLMKRV
jgi:hypothetical protein